VVTNLWPPRQIKLLIEKGFRPRESSPEKAALYHCFKSQKRQGSPVWGKYGASGRPLQFIVRMILGLAALLALIAAPRAVSLQVIGDTTSANDSAPHRIFVTQSKVSSTTQGEGSTAVTNCSANIHRQMGIPEQIPDDVRSEGSSVRALDRQSARIRPCRTGPSHSCPYGCKSSLRFILKSDRPPIQAHSAKTRGTRTVQPKDAP
jgi:hypothetical protein